MCVTNTFKLTKKKENRKSKGQTDKAPVKMSPPSHFDFIEARDKFTVNYHYKHLPIDKLWHSQTILRTTCFVSISCLPSLSSEVVCSSRYYHNIYYLSCIRPIGLDICV